MMIFSSLLKVN